MDALPLRSWRPLHLGGEKSFTCYLVSSTLLTRRTTAKGSAALTRLHPNPPAIARPGTDA
jgi:hypothetical protein